MTSFLTGKLLIAMPGLTDTTFADSVVFLCAHSHEGAMGITINKPLPGAGFMEVADKLDWSTSTPETRARLAEMPVLSGGPVDSHRGFVLHSADYAAGESSLEVTPAFKLTATVDVLQDMVNGKGPQAALLALGYAGWAPGQLESEILHNGWLHCDADAALVFAPDWPGKHRHAMARLGIDPRMLSSTAGHG